MKRRSSSNEFHFVEHSLTDAASLALFWAQSRLRVGIYRLDFSDESSYIGQSISIRSRLAAHRRRWDDAVRIRFAACPRELLNEMELRTIQDVQKTRPLRNKLLTSRPGGEADTRFTFSGGQTLTLPWDRARRGTLSAIAPEHDKDAAAQRKYMALAGSAVYERIANTSAALIAGAVPSPVDTQRTLWTVSALPSTNGAPGWRRMLTLSAGRLEILRFFEDSSGRQTRYPGYLNVTNSRTGIDLSRALRKARLGHLTLFNGRYQAFTSVHTIEIPDLVTAERVLDEDFILDAVYELVVASMRQGSAPLGRFHNWYLAEDLIRRARNFQDRP